MATEQESKPERCPTCDSKTEESSNCTNPNHAEMGDHWAGEKPTCYFCPDTWHTEPAAQAEQPHCNVNPVTDRCVQCGRNRWQRDKFGPICPFQPEAAPAPAAAPQLNMRFCHVCKKNVVSCEHFGPVYTIQKRRTMRLPKNAAYPGYNEVHEENQWCTKAGCIPINEAAPAPAAALQQEGCEKCHHPIGYHATHPEGRCTCEDCHCDGYYHKGMDLYARDKPAAPSCMAELPTEINDKLGWVYDPDALLSVVRFWNDQRWHFCSSCQALAFNFAEAFSASQNAVLRKLIDEVGLKTLGEMNWDRLALLEQQNATLTTERDELQDKLAWERQQRNEGFKVPALEKERDNLEKSLRDLTKHGNDSERELEQATMERNELRKENERLREGKMARGVKSSCIFCGTKIEDGDQSCQRDIGWYHEDCLVGTAPTIEAWFGKMFPGANLDNLEINVRLAIQIAKQFSAFHVAALDAGKDA